jgi:hypothetical protein
MFKDKAKPKAKAEPKPKAGSQKGSKAETKEEAVSASEPIFNPSAVFTMDMYMTSQGIMYKTWELMKTDAELRKRILSGGKVAGKRKRAVKAEYEPSKASSTFLMWSSSAEGKAFASRKERAEAWKNMKAANDPVYQKYTELYKELQTKFETIRSAYESMYQSESATDETKKAYIKMYDQWCLERKAGLPVEDEEEDEEDEEDEEVEQPPTKRARTQASSPAPVAAGAGAPSGSQEF